ncbi:uncharacterized protein PAC_05807 [Phialocephala subalpina]|uniref:Uncharacterized protein n=1 Tax=Phialocephala subalpina TaxID=576137 RepID=A0A1L7WT21_9HELO|nr:uncharacterized protein PAC_05807 [Phialocephala subalpina]
MEAEQAKESQNARVTELEAKLKTMELKLDAQGTKTRLAREDVGTVKGEWAKKLQRVYNKNSDLEKQLSEERTINKNLMSIAESPGSSRNDASDVETLRTTLKKQFKKFKSQAEEKYKKLEDAHKECESRIRSLRSNEDIVQERIQKALAATVSKVTQEKDVCIAELKTQNESLDQGRQADAE